LSVLSENRACIRESFDRVEFGRGDGVVTREIVDDVPRLAVVWRWSRACPAFMKARKDLKSQRFIARLIFHDRDDGNCAGRTRSA
jgi:hypothetical protein